MNNVNIERGNNGLGRQEPTEDAISAIIANGPSAFGGVQTEVIYRLSSLDDAALIAIDEDYDNDNDVLVYEHIKEFFRINPDTDLYIYLADASVHYADGDDDILDYAEIFLDSLAGKAKQLGVVHNTANLGAPAQAYELKDIIAKAQALAKSQADKDRPISIILEGSSADVELSNPILDLHDENSEYVSVAIGQSYSVASRVGTHHRVYAAVGAELGVVSLSKVNESKSWPEQFNMYGGTLLDASIKGDKISSISQGVLNELHDKAYNFFITYTDFAGIYCNDSFTCTSLTSDYAYIENVRTMNKAIREIRKVMIPKISSPVQVDPDNGQISAEIIKSFENDCRKPLERMFDAGELSGHKVTIDPQQNILATSSLDIVLSLTPTGTARKINVKIGFNNPF